MRTVRACALVSAVLALGCREDDAGSGSGETEGSGTTSVGTNDGADETETGVADAGETGDDACAELPERIEADMAAGPGCVRLDRTEIRAGATLEIAAGTEVLVEPGGHLGVGVAESGILVARGTADDPIRFVSRLATPGPGDWECLYFGNAGGSELEHVQIEHAGAQCNVTGTRQPAAVVVSGPVRTLSNIEITDGAGRALWVDHRAEIQSFVDIAFARNVAPSVWVAAPSMLMIGESSFDDPDDFIHVDTTFNLDRSGRLARQSVPYRISGRLTLWMNAELSIAPGTVLALTGPGIDVFMGRLTAVGTPDEPIVFTSGAASAGRGDWGCLFLDSDDLHTQRHTIVEYAGSGAGCGGANLRAAVADVSASAVIEDNLFRHIAGNAIRGVFGQCDESWCDNTFEDIEGDPLFCPGQEPEARSCE
jgi:hypothetical protein